MAKTVQDLLEDDKLNDEQRRIALNEIPGYKIEPVNSEIGFEKLYGKATAYNQNCSFHCLAESLFNLPEDKLSIVQNFPGFQYICNAFAECYGIDEPVNLAFLVEFNKKILHPYDFQLVWGPVLRLAFQKYMDESGLADTYNLKKNSKWDPVEAISPDALSAFIGALGGKIFTINEHEPDPRYKKALADGFGFDPPCWEIRLKLERLKKDDGSYYIGGHYIFEVPPTQSHLGRQTARDAMLVLEPREAHEEWSQWYDESGQIQSGLRWTIDDTPGYLIPADNSASGLEASSAEKYGKRFHKITGNMAEDGRALRAALLREFVQKRNKLKLADIKALETNQDDFETGNETSTGYHSEEPIDQPEAPSIFEQIVGAFQAFFSAIASVFTAFLGFLFGKPVENDTPPPEHDEHHRHDHSPVQDDHHGDDTEISHKNGITHQLNGAKAGPEVDVKPEDLSKKPTTPPPGRK